MRTTIFAYLITVFAVKAQNTCLYCSSSANSSSTDCVNGISAQNVTVPADYNGICSTTVVYSGLLSSQNDPASMNIVQVIRSIPILQVEYEKRVIGGPLNSTGTLCSAIGDILKCTHTCYGDNCNSVPVRALADTPPMQQRCTKCTEVVTSPDFFGCLSGSNETLVDDGPIALTYNNAGQNFASDKLAGMCATVVNYNSSGYPVAVSRQAGGLDGVLPAPKSVNFTTLGQCQMVSTNVLGHDVDTMTCVKGTLEFVDQDQFGRATSTFSNTLPAPTSDASCWSCSAMVNEVDFDYCANPGNQTVEDLANYGVGISNCPLPIDRKDDSQKPASNCFVMTLFSEDGSTTIGIQRGCVPPAYFTYPDNAPSTCVNGNELITSVNSTKVCISQCTTNSTTGPCNSYSNTFSTNAHSSHASSIFVSSLTVILAALTSLYL